MVGDVTGYAGWRNANEVVNMQFLDDDEKKIHIKKLWKEDPQKYFEWKDWCISLNRLPKFFGNSDHIFYHTRLFNSQRGCLIYLKMNENCFDIISKDSATHVLEQVFDEDDQLISEELKELI